MIDANGKCGRCGHRGFYPRIHLEFTSTPGAPVGDEPVAADRKILLECSNRECRATHEWQPASNLQRWS